MREGDAFLYGFADFANTCISGCATDAITRFTNGGEGLENEGREGRKGLWADPQPVPPWEWRRCRD